MQAVFVRRCTILAKKSFLNFYFSKELFQRHFVKVNTLIIKLITIAITMELGVNNKDQDDKIYCNVLPTTTKSKFLILY